jgi:hypothetical protein
MGLFIATYGQTEAGQSKLQIEENIRNAHLLWERALLVTHIQLEIVSFVTQT